MSFISYIPPQGRRLLAYRRTFRERGRQSLASPGVSTQFPFGLVETSLEAGPGREIVVLPRLGAINSEALVRTGGHGASWLRAVSRKSALGEFRSLRQYREGDSVYHIHWRTSARMRELYVKEFERVDFCEEAWEGPPQDAFCVWRTRVPVKEQKKRPLVDEGVMLDFFTRLEDQTDPAKINFRYILALLLMRKRILKLLDTVREGDAEYLLCFCRRTDSEHRVLDPHLTEDQIAGVQQEVGALLNADV